MNSSETSDLKEWIRFQMNGSNKTISWNWENIARRFGTSYIILGSFAIIVNILIFICIFLRRRTTFSHVFYIIILNFTIIDIIKGICSILFALKLLKSNMSIDSSTWTIRIDQYSGVLLKFTNLTTILNLLLITMNEFLFIRYPLRYSTIVTRFRVLSAIVASWLLASLLTLFNMLTNVRQRSVMIDTDCENGEISYCIRHQQTSVAHYFVFHLSLITFCLICLSITASCYFYLFRLVSKLVKSDAKHQAEIDLLKDDTNHTKSIARRRKYVIMIGSVIVVYTLYLTTYAVLQGMQLLNISRKSKSVHIRTEYIFTKYICYLCLSLHSILQPLCFMRMREFRNILKRTLCIFTKQEPVLSTEFFKRQSQPTDI